MWLEARTRLLAQVLGSLELLFNPTGLLAALAQGIQDLVLLPLEAQSPGQARLPLSLARTACAHVLGWPAAEPLHSPTTLLGGHFSAAV